MCVIVCGTSFAMIWFQIYCCWFLIKFASSSKILAVLPTASRSHFIVFQPLLLELSARGHDVTVVSNFPQSSPVKGYKDIDIQNFKRVYSSDVPLEFLAHVPGTFEDNIVDLYKEIEDFENVFLSPDVTNLINSEKTFDLVITELWITDMFLGFGFRFGAPVVAISSCSIYPWTNERFGNPDNPSYIPTNFFPKVSKMSFWERLQNSYQLLVSKFAYDYFYNPLSEKIAKKIFGKDLPRLDVLARNISLFLVNTHHSFQGSRPTSPQVVEIGGIHVKDPKPLPEDLEQWMRDAPQGVIYFSFGSILRGASLPPDKVQAFLKAFERLPQKVLWKWEDEGGLKLPRNVKISKWLPQRDILAHPSTRVFVSHGGLLGVTEAVVSGVPVLGIPMFADQPHNVAAQVEHGAGVHMDYSNITEESLSWALNALLNDRSFSENAKQLSRRFLDRPQSPLETAVYWTEYVIRHRGAKHLQSAAVHLPWYQYLLLDVLAVLLAGLAVILAVLYYIIKTCISLVGCKKTTKLKTN